MAVVKHRNAFFNALAASHTAIPLALSSGWILEEVELTLAFRTHTFDQTLWQNWRQSRVGWGLWFGPSSAGAVDWSTDRSDAEMVYWTDAAWEMGQSLAEDTGGVAFGTTWFWAGVLGRPLVIPVWREAAGVEYQIRVVAEESTLTSFFTYTMAGALSARIAQ